MSGISFPVVQAGSDRGSRDATPPPLCTFPSFPCPSAAAPPGELRTRSGKVIRSADRLRQAVAPGAGEHDLDRPLEPAAVPRRDVHRPDAVPGPHVAADDLVAMDQGLARPPPEGRLAVLPHEERLPAPDRGPVEHHPEVTGDAEAPRVGEP